MRENEKSGKNDKKIIYFEFLHDRSAIYLHIKNIAKNKKLNMIEKNKN